jgi:hypothetical protein
VEDGVDMDGQLREIRGAWERVREMLDQKEEEVVELKAQVRGLKEWVSVSTRADGETQTSDEVFGEGMARLGNGLQNWVLVNFRRAKLGKCLWGTRSRRVGRALTVADLSSAHEDTISELARLVPMYEELASTSRIHLLQSVVSRFLVELVFDAYFIGLPTDVAAQIKQVEAFLSSSKILSRQMKEKKYSFPPSLIPRVGQPMALPHPHYHQKGRQREARDRNFQDR